MKRAMGWLVSWALYWLGHAVSRVMNWADAGWPYPAYRWLMLASVDVRDWGGAGPWERAET